ncbi:hypothetical protein EV193_101115 [Herbihabitans rhizosphaerae]|uniref:Polymerase/histidinol phosphatase N-terminal domain-containing protein n=1 Tax=Herbihabitans rhizosphaerae TaxID=1872711 RepID=A0A4Q7L5X6_9PSEU|nr:PHP domain-containing protein [Herbihabitans rhizosphaerae]RZS44240.1 hypothetical protein EV193_101115 [Herbihabitans rhizosphaerae]
MRIDLHAHSTASDGTDTPAQLVANAAAVGLDAVAITDHDTTAGWAEAAAALTSIQPSGLRLVRGAELSCESPDGRGGRCTVHVLAYLFDPESEAVVAEHARSRADRRVRLHRMAGMMAADGFPIDPDALLGALPEDSTAGRPHLATALMRAGVVGSVGEAFSRFLGSAGGYYVAMKKTPVLDAIEMITAAGGVTVLAHAFAHRRGPTVTAEVIADLAAAGLAGVEVDHPDHEPAVRDELRAIAGRLDLLITGSSDYHGSNKTVRLGQETTAPEMLDALAERAKGVDVLVG